MAKSYNSVDEVLKNICYDQVIQILNVRSEIRESIKDEKKVEIIIFKLLKEMKLIPHIFLTNRDEMEEIAIHNAKCINKLLRSMNQK